jgi:hypothetical protein
MQIKYIQCKRKVNVVKDFVQACTDGPDGDEAEDGESNQAIRSVIKMVEDTLTYSPVHE